MRLALLVLLLGVAGCSSSSNCVNTATLSIQVVDDESQVSLCGATVTIAPLGGAATTIAPTAMTSPCSFQTPVQAGTYQISVVAAGYQSQSSTTKVGTIQCTVEAGNVTFSMTPAR